jgi:hypothetical protein
MVSLFALWEFLHSGSIIQTFIQNPKEKKMNTRKLLVSVLVLVSVLFSACAPTTLATPAPTATPPAAKVIAEWTVINPEDIVFGFDSVWVPSRRDPNVTTRIDPVSNEVIAVIKGTGQWAKSAAVTGDSVWVAGQSNDLAPIDPKTNTLGTKVPGDHPRIVYGFNSIWAVGHQGEPLDRVDPATSTIIASIPLGGTVSGEGEENDVLVTVSAVWVISNGELIKIDPATNSVVMRTTFDRILEEAKAQTTVPAGKGTDFIWLSLDKGLVRIDPNTGAGLTLLLLSAEQLGSVAVTDNAVWLGGYGQINRVNVATNQIDATYMVQQHGALIIVRVGFGSVWVTSEVTNLVQRLDITP